MITASAHATIRGDDYHCNAGFLEDDNGLCEAVVASANASVCGDGWTVIRGMRGLKVKFAAGSIDLSLTSA